MGSLGTAGWDSRARSSVLSLQTAIVPRAFPSRRIPVCGGRWQLLAPDGGMPQAAPASSSAFKEGVGSPQAANQLGMTSEYADGHPGGQLQHQRLATFPVCPTLTAPAARQASALRCPCWLPRCAEAQKSNFPLELGQEPHSRPRMVNCW